MEFPDKEDVDENFKNIIGLPYLNGHYTAVATHDERIIQYSKEESVKKHGISMNRLNFRCYTAFDRIKKASSARGRTI